MQIITLHQVSSFGVNERNLQRITASSLVLLRNDHTTYVGPIIPSNFQKSWRGLLISALPKHVVLPQARLSMRPASCTKWTELAYQTALPACLESIYVLSPTLIYDLPMGLQDWMKSLNKDAKFEMKLPKCSLYLRRQIMKAFFIPRFVVGALCEVPLICVKVLLCVKSLCASFTR